MKWCHKLLKNMKCCKYPQRLKEVLTKVMEDENLRDDE